MTVDDFQRLAGEQGRQFEEAVVFALQAAGWAIVAQRAKVAQAEIDIVAVSPTGVEWWIECKGSYRGKTPGAKRGDTTKKAVAIAAYLAVVVPSELRRPYMLLTSHLPTPGTLSHLMLEAAKAQGWFAKVDTLGFTPSFENEDEEDA
jgi:hypothetical protein